MAEERDGQMMNKISKVIKEWLNEWTYCEDCELYVHLKTKCNCK